MPADNWLEGVAQRSQGKPMHFKGGVFHRVIPDLMCQVGDFTAGNGTGDYSIPGPSSQKG